MYGILIAFKFGSKWNQLKIRLFIVYEYGFLRGVIIEMILEHELKFAVPQKSIFV